MRARSINASTSLVGVDERRSAVPPQADQPGRRDLGARVDPGEVAREPADDQQPHRRHDAAGRHVTVPAPTRAPASIGHDLGADSVEVRDEPRQQAGVLVELEPERASQPQVVIDVLGEAWSSQSLPATAAATWRSRSRSTLA